MGSDLTAEEESVMTVGSRAVEVVGSKFSTRRERMVRAISKFSQAICKSSVGSAISSGWDDCSGDSSSLFSFDSVCSGAGWN